MLISILIKTNWQLEFSYRCDNRIKLDKHCAMINFFAMGTALLCLKRFIRATKRINFIIFVSRALWIWNASNSYSIYVATVTDGETRQRHTSSIPGACPTKYRIDKFDRIQNLLKILVPLISIRYLVGQAPALGYLPYQEQGRGVGWHRSLTPNTVHQSQCRVRPLWRRRQWIHHNWFAK